MGTGDPTHDGAPGAARDISRVPDGEIETTERRAHASAGREGEVGTEVLGPVFGSAEHRAHQVTPATLQSWQMKVPHPSQGYPSEARSVRPQARQTI